MARKWRRFSRPSYCLLFALILCLTRYFVLNRNPRYSIGEDDFDYSTVIYPSPNDRARETLPVYFRKKDHLASVEDQLSVSKKRKIIHENVRVIIPNQQFLLIEYTKIFGIRKFCSKNSTEIFGEECPYQNCFYSCDQSLAAQAHLLLFHKYDVTPATVPPANFTRSPSQIWLLWHDEPNFYHGYDLNVYEFNWTTSYVFDAEASIGAYGMTIKRASPWSEVDLRRYTSKQFSSRRHQALWFVTNCGAKRRLNYFWQLRDYFPIQAFGTCVPSNESTPSSSALQWANRLISGEKRIPPGTSIASNCSRWSSCEEDQVKWNMFYLSFESQSCKDYISEKFWRALKYGLIPSKDHLPSTALQIRLFQLP